MTREPVRRPVTSPPRGGRPSRTPTRRVGAERRTGSPDEPKLAPRGVARRVRIEPWRGSSTVATVTAGAQTDRIWSMSKLQIRSIEPPLDDPETTDAAIDVLKSMEAMGLLPDDVDELTLEVIRTVATRAAEVGIGESAAASLHRPPRPPGHVAAALRELGLALEGSPMPAFEWPAMSELFGAERLAEL